MDSKTGIKLTLVGQDGNAFYILGRAQRALKQAGKHALVKEFHNEAMAGDYDHLLRTCMEWFDTE